MYFIPQIIKFASLLLLVVVEFAYCDENRCPASTDINPCTCSSSDLDTGLIVRCNGFSNDHSIEGLQKALNKLSGMKIKSLRLTAFNRVPSELFDGLVIQEVHLVYKVSIGEMPSFKGSENALQVFEVEQFDYPNSTTQNFALKVSHLNKLKSFIFNRGLICMDFDKIQYGDEIISVGNDWFANGPPSLESVQLMCNRAKSFGDRVFSELVGLKEVDLSQNRIEEVHRSMFPDPAQRLLSIKLKWNYIKSLPGDIFSRMPVLEKVDVAANLFSVLDELTWKPVWEQLDYLSFGYINGINCDRKIFWTFGLRRPKYLQVECSKEGKSSKEYEGRSLKDIIDERQSLSSNRS